MIRGAAYSKIFPGLPTCRGYHVPPPKRNFEDIRYTQPDQYFYALRINSCPDKTLFVKIIALTHSSSLEEVNQSEGQSEGQKLRNTS